MKQARALYDPVPVEVSTVAFSSPTAIARLDSWSSSVTGVGHAHVYFRDKIMVQRRRWWQLHRVKLSCMCGVVHLVDVESSTVKN